MAVGTATNYRWTPGVPGWYMVSFGCTGPGAERLSCSRALQEWSAHQLINYAAAICRNHCSGTELVYMNGDHHYLELYAFVNGSSPVVKFELTAHGMSGVFDERNRLTRCSASPAFPLWPSPNPAPPGARKARLSAGASTPFRHRVHHPVRTRAESPSVQLWSTAYHAARVQVASPLGGARAVSQHAACRGLPKADSPLGTARATAVHDFSLWPR